MYRMSRISCEISSLGESFVSLVKTIPVNESLKRIQQGFI